MTQLLSHQTTDILFSISKDLGLDADELSIKNDTVWRPGVDGRWMAVCDLGSTFWTTHAGIVGATQ